MGSSKGSFLTAIRDSELENSVAATIAGRGWVLALRGTSSSQISRYLSENPKVHLIASSDFRGLEELLIYSPTIVNKESDQSIAEQLEAIVFNSVEHQHNLPLIHQQCIAFISPLRRVGTTTYAINHAKYASENGLRTLLIDGAIDSPSLARYLNLHQISHEPQNLTPTLALFEITGEASLEKLRHCAPGFDAIYIDLGELKKFHYESGRRMHERVTRWGLSSATKVNLVTTSDFETSLTTQGDINEIVVCEENLTGRKRHLFIESLEAKRGRSVTLYPRDSEAISRGRAKSGFLIEEAPKSLLARTIRAHGEHQLFLTHARIPSTHSR